MSGPPLHVLIVGADQAALDDATLALARTGHTVSHVTPESRTPFRWPAPDGGPFEPASVDVVLSIPGHALSTVPWCEDRVIGLVHEGVPLVLAGTPLASPFTAWASHCVGPGDNLVNVCESAVQQRSRAGAAEDRDVIGPRFGPIDFDQSGGEVLTRRRCLALLETATVGRVGMTSGALPVVVPVDYRMWGDQVVFRTQAGVRLHTATSDAVVAFEVDALGPTYPWGWTVVVTGMARDVTDTAAASAVRFDAEGWWTSGGEDRLMAVPTDVVAGCRLRARPPAAV